MFGDRWTRAGFIAVALTYTFSERPWRRIVLLLLAWTALFIAGTDITHVDPDTLGPAALEQTGTWHLTVWSWISIVGFVLTLLAAPAAMRASRRVRQARLFERDVQATERAAEVVEEAQERYSMADADPRIDTVIVPPVSGVADPVQRMETTPDGLVIRDRRTVDPETL